MYRDSILSDSRISYIFPYIRKYGKEAIHQPIARGLFAELFFEKIKSNNIEIFISDDEQIVNDVCRFAHLSNYDLKGWVISIDPDTEKIEESKRKALFILDRSNKKWIRKLNPQLIIKLTSDRLEYTLK